MRSLILPVLLVASVLVGQPALVQAGDDGEAAYLRSVTVMNMDAEARRVVTQDRVNVTLSIQRDGKTAAEAQAAVNAKMQEALAAAKKMPSVKVSTGYYNVYKQYPPEPGPQPHSVKEREKKAYWTAQQTVVLDGADPASPEGGSAGHGKDAVLKLAGVLQGMDFAMQGMNFYLSREAQNKIKDELLAEALASVKARAQKVAGIMGTPNIRFARINLMNGGPVYPVMMKSARMDMAMAAEAMPAPAGAAGESEVTLSVNVEVHLR